MRLKLVKHSAMLLWTNIAVITVGIMLLPMFLLNYSIIQQKHWLVVEEENKFEESSKELRNPNRGFYSMYGFFIRDSDTNYAQQVESKMSYDTHTLSLIQINLARYKTGPITEQGLANIHSLFQALDILDKQYIVRFLYDWDGRGMEAEPEELDIILEHMNQLKGILEEYRQCIFVFQGVFVGSWGEMHGTRHMSRESMRMLVQQWFDATPEGTFLSVRTPLHWRIVTASSEENDFSRSALSKRLGLYNDGMMGTEQDTGTYGTLSKSEVGYLSAWNRAEELDFQEELCKVVPNGGEVIIDNPFNDFENAVKSMATMHVTYLNKAYDSRVLNKWANSTVTEPGCFYGLDGLSYVRRMLGYRHLIDTVSMRYDFWSDKLDVVINMKNVGFAPIYKEPKKYMMVHNMETDEVWTYPVEAELCSLAGGNDKEQILTITKEISLSGFKPGEYDIYFQMKDIDSGWYLELANEQEMTELGYLVGSFSVGKLKNPFTGKILDIEEMLNKFLDKMEAVYE